MNASSMVGRYTLREEVGRGAFGVVYRALDPRGQQVALKLFKLNAGNERQQRRFKVEVQALLRIRHPHVVGLLDAGTAQGVGTPYLVLEWVDGETLQERVARAGPLDWPEAAQLIQRLALAMSFCHAQGVLHRDIKPGNVLLRRSDGAPLLADFGLAKASLDGHSLGPVGARTAEGAPLGTPGYWAPEQARGQLDQLGPTADVYGLGATLYFALTGRSPHQAREQVSVFEALERLPDPPSRLAPRTPALLDQVCLRCLEPDPVRRYQDARALAAALSAVAGASPRPAPRSPLRLAVPALAVVTVAVLASAVWVGQRAARQVTDPGPDQVPDQGPDQVSGREPPPPSPPPPAPEPSTTDPLQPADVHGPAPAPPPVDPARRAAAEDEYLRSYQLSQRGDLEGALSALEHALELDPGRAELWSTRAALRSQAGDLSGAERDLDRALELDPTHPDLWRNRAIVRGMQENTRGAEDDLTHALQVDPYHVPSLRERAVARLRLGNDAGCVEDLDRALRLSPGDPDLLYNRALGRIGLGQPQEALQDLIAAEPGIPNRGRLLKVRANVRLELKDVSGARADCEAALALGSPPAELLTTRAHVRIEQGDPRGALEDLDAARAIDPYALGLEELEARAWVALEDWPRVRSACERLLQRDPGEPYGWYGSGCALQELGDAPGARAALNRFLQLAPDHDLAPLARQRLARLGPG